MVPRVHRPLGGLDLIDSKHAKDHRRNRVEPKLFVMYPVRMVRRAHPEHAIGVVHPALDPLNLIKEVEERSSAVDGGRSDDHAARQLVRDPARA